MGRDLRASLIATLALTVLLGLVYPLATTGIAQVVFGSKADGSRIEREGKTVGSELIGQSFQANNTTDAETAARYFQSRPSATGYSPDVTFFNNLGPNSKALAHQFETRVKKYLATEGPYNPGLSAGDIPPDAVTTSASGVDPHISEANARIQANRIAEVRGISLDRVLALIEENTDGRALGVLGEPGVNVLELNLAIEAEASR